MDPEAQGAMQVLRVDGVPKFIGKNTERWSKSMGFSVSVFRIKGIDPARAMFSAPSAGCGAVGALPW
jgi:hypothetical protein